MRAGRYRGLGDAHDWSRAYRSSVIGLSAGSVVGAVVLVIATRGGL
ncbi:MAG: hypothetical protein ABWY81_06040 [Jiangellaceae bacterium]